MKAFVYTLLIAFAVIGSGQFGYAAETSIAGRDANVLVTIFQQAGVRLEPSIVSGRYLMTTNGMRCVLQMRAPGASFIPTCTVLDRFNRDLRVDERQLQALVSILTRAGIRPVSNGSETTLTTGGIDCQLDQVTAAALAVSACFIE